MTLPGRMMRGLTRCEAVMLHVERNKCPRSPQLLFLFLRLFLHIFSLRNETTFKACKIVYGSSKDRILSAHCYCTNRGWCCDGTDM